MADSNSRTAIVVALIALLGTIGAALIANPGAFKQFFDRAHESRMSEMEFNTDRFGGDYTGFELPMDNPKLCEDTCRKAPRCLAWTYIKPNTGKGPKPLCTLKDTVTPPQRNQNCVSGIKVSQSVSPVDQGRTVFATEPMSLHMGVIGY